MGTQQIAVRAILVAQVALTGCDTVERVRTRFGATTTDTVVTARGSGLALGLQTPPALRPGDEGLLRLTLNNQTDTAVSQVRLELHVPGWAEPMPPRAGDRPVTMAALESGSTVFTFRMDDTPLKPGQIETVDQRIRVPVAGIARGGPSFNRTVRARLLAADGRALAEVQTEIAADSAAIAAATTTAEAAPPRRRERIGMVELGMTTSAVKQAAAGARDTTWTEGTARQRGLVIPVANRSALAVLSGDAVTRIEAGYPEIKTEEGLGVGSRLSDLRAAYGNPCADVIDGRVVVWFAGVPGAAFALDASVPRPPAQLEPARIPDTAQVTRWWLSRDIHSCPTGG